MQFGARGLITSGFFIFRSPINMEKIPFTRDGVEKIRMELARLEKEERPENIRAIEEARSHGDLSENAEYHAAKERQSFLDGKINELKDVLGRAEIIETDGSPADSVVFGRTVVLYDIQTDEEVIYTMVGPYESNPKNGMISVTSPLGQALIGRKTGDEVQARTPRGILEFEILEIQ
jgi:transcription elongation factor GreA